MESMNQFEKTIEGWLKPLPHLPATWRKWIGENIWWITLIGVILSIMGVFVMIGAIFTAMSIFGVATGVFGYVAPVYTGWWMLASVVSLAFMVITVAITAMAVSPLKNQKKKGWDLLFLTFVINVVAAVVNVVLSFSAISFIPALISAAIGAAISAYFLFEIRSQFNSATVLDKK